LHILTHHLLNALPPIVHDSPPPLLGSRFNVNVLSIGGLLSFSRFVRAHNHFSFLDGLSKRFTIRSSSGRQTVVLRHAIYFLSFAFSMSPFSIHFAIRSSSGRQMFVLRYTILPFFRIHGVGFSSCHMPDTIVCAIYCTWSILSPLTLSL